MAAWANNNNQTMLINGSNFQSGATLTFNDPQNNVYSGRSATFISSSQLSHAFNNGNDPGTWKVAMVNPNGETSSLWNFTVTGASPPPTPTGLSPGGSFFRELAKLDASQMPLR